MKKENIIKEKTYSLAIKIVNLCAQLSHQKKDIVLTRQLLRSGTSIGANVREALSGTSSKDFIYKMSLVQKEAKETLYWLNLIRDTKLINEEVGQRLINDTEEIIRIVSKIIITTKVRLNSSNPH